jgi:rsbT co-antagonist protein RsbR
MSARRGGGVTMAGFRTGIWGNGWFLSFEELRRLPEVDTGAKIAIIDITGVPTVDTLVAQHLLKTVAAARLMGAECYISGIRPQIAQTIVQLGVELNDVVTKATLADAFHIAVERCGFQIAKSGG